jgi:hypothetical protein
MLDRSPRHWCVSLIAALLVGVSLAPTAWPQAGLEAQSLVGLWSGQWTWKTDSRWNGPYALTIEKVDGRKVYGAGDYVGMTSSGSRGPRNFKFIGTLEGNRLTFGRDTITELVIDGNQMTGQGGNLNIKLLKTK